MTEGLPDGVTPDVVAVTTDLMDRSRLRSALEAVRFAGPGDDLGEPDVVLVDLRHDRAVDAALATGARVIGYGSHVDEATLAAAAGRGVEALPRSRFFRRVAAGTLL